MTPDEDIPVGERPDAVFVEGYASTADHDCGEGITVELWGWHGQFFLKSTEVIGVLDKQLSTEWRRLGEVSEQEALAEMAELLSCLMDERGPESL